MTSIQKIVINFLALNYPPPNSCGELHASGMVKLILWAAKLQFAQTHSLFSTLCSLHGRAIHLQKWFNSIHCTQQEMLF